MRNQMSEPERIDVELDRALESLSRAIKDNPRAQEPEPEKKLPAKVIQLPLWAEPARGMMNATLRSALFAAVCSKDRRFMNRELIAAVNGVEIRFKGEQLNQEDLDVCAEVFHLARLHPLGDTCHTSAHGLLKALGRHTGKYEHEQLHASLIRLQAHSVEINGPRLDYFGSLVLEGVKDKLTRQYVIKLSPKLAPLFRQGWTGLDPERRRQLRRKPLALWLDAFYATHEEPYPYKVETLRDLSGSRTERLRRFREALRRALADLQATGAIASWDIDPESDLVHVHKVTTITCRRKLPKAKKQALGSR
jgi:TrfA protein